MWWDVAIDLLWPGGRARPVEDSFAQGDPETLTVEFEVPGAFRRRLNESGWLTEEVLAAGLLRQGKPYSLLGLVTGLVLVDVVRRRSKSPPREFVLAVTPGRVVAFALSLVAVGDTTSDDIVAVKVKAGERGSWPRELVRLLDPSKGFGSKGWTLELAGVEGIPVASGDDSSLELLELLGG
jgi:hypothetical protein